MLSESYINSRKQIIRWWVFEHTLLRGNAAKELANKIFLKYYSKSL